jgi:hypothetical protein
MEWAMLGIGQDQQPVLCLVNGQHWSERTEAEKVDPVARAPASPTHQQEDFEDGASKVVSLRSPKGCYDPWGISGLLDLEKAFINPACVFGSPADVVRYPLLTLDCKREILWRWAWDEYLLDFANADGMPESEPSRLPEVKAALRLVNSEWSPDPAAPAAYIVRYDRQGLALAA